MPNTSYVASSRGGFAAERHLRRMLVLVAFASPLGCVTTRVVERPADTAIDVPADVPPPPYRTGGDDDATWSAARRDAPDVRIWTAEDRTYQRGDRVRGLFRAREDAYVTIVRVDTDGRMQVLFPRAPYADAFVRGGRTYRVPGSAGASFVVDDLTGVGYLFAISSYRPFDFERYRAGNGWDYAALGGRLHGDPLQALHDFAERIAYDANTGYATDFAEYYVDRRVEYPRYAFPACADVSVYDPYDSPCTRYRVVIYEDTYYYPYRYYPGTRVVYAPRSRYEWKPATPLPGTGRRPVYVEHRRRPSDLGSPRPGTPGRVAGGPVGNPGATRPGDDVTPNGGGRRRPDDAGRPNGQPPRYGARPPRQDSSRVTPGTPPANGGGSSNAGGNGGNGGNGNGGSDVDHGNNGNGNGNSGNNGNGNNGTGNGNGNGNGNGGNNGNGDAQHGRGPRTDPATSRDGGHDNGRGRGNGDGRDDSRRTGDDSATVTRSVVAPFGGRVPNARRGEPDRTDSPSAEAPRGGSPAAPAAVVPDERPSNRAADDHLRGADRREETPRDVRRSEPPAREQPDPEQPVREQPVREQPVREQPVREQPVREEPVREEPRTSSPPADAPRREDARDSAREERGADRGADRAEERPAPAREAERPSDARRGDDRPREVRERDSGRQSDDRKPAERKADERKSDDRKSDDKPAPVPTRRRVP